MTSAFQPLPSLSARKKKLIVGEAELSNLFALFPEAALLVDTTRNKIVQANPAFLALTSYSVNEMTGHAPEEFLAGGQPLGGKGEDTVQLFLSRRGRDAIPVSLQMRLLDVGGVWLLMICRPQIDQRSKLQADMRRSVECLHKMDRLADRILRPEEAGEEDRPVEVEMECAKLICDVFQAECIAFYQVVPGGSDLAKLCECGEADLLPGAIPAEDYLRLAHPFVWKPGRRMQTELHRLGRVKSLSYIATTQYENQGLAVMAGRAQEPWTNMETLFAALVEHTALLSSIQAQHGAVRSALALARRETHTWRQAVESASEGIIILSEDLTVEEMNPNAEWMLGYAAWEVRGQPVENVLIGPEGLQPALVAACQGLPTHNLGMVALHRRSGQSFPANVQVIPVYAAGAPPEIMVFFNDVSEHEEIRQRSQQLEQRVFLGEVTAVFAHEVRNPINNISTGLQLISAKLPENDPNQDSISRLINDCARLNHLMESVLSFSKGLDYKFEEVDLAGLLRRILDRWRPRMAKVNVNAELYPDPTAPHAQGDPRALEQVFTNLISNAVEAMSAGGGTLAVRITPENSLPTYPQVEVTVSDTGPGISDEVRERMFEPFVTTKSTGTGLGLAITKRIVTGHHGFIDVNSFPGGTVFRVILMAYQGDKG